MGKDNSTSSLWGRLTQGLFSKSSHTSALPSSSRTTLNGNATTPATFSLIDQDVSMDQIFNANMVPPIASGSDFKTGGTSVAPTGPIQFFSPISSQIGRYKSKHRARDRLRALNLRPAGKVMRFVDRFQNKTAKPRPLRRGPNWMQIRNMNRRAEMEEAGESGRSNITAEQLGQILRRNPDVPQVIMPSVPSRKGKEKAVEEVNDGDTDNGDTDTDGDTDNGGTDADEDTGSRTDDTDTDEEEEEEEEDKENTAPIAGPSTPGVLNTTNTQEQVTPLRISGPSTHSATTGRVEGKDELKIPETPVPNRKLRSPASFSTIPIFEEVYATPTKPNGLGKQASTPLVLSDPFEATCQPKVSNNIEKSQFPPTQPQPTAFTHSSGSTQSQPATLALPSRTTQPAFQELLPSFPCSNILPTICDQYIAGQRQTGIYNQPAHQQHQKTGGPHVPFPNVSQFGYPQDAPFGGITQLTSQETQQLQFSFPAQLETPQQLQAPFHMPPTAPELQQPQYLFSSPAANNALSQSVVQPQQQQQTFSSMFMNSNFQQSAALGVGNSSYQNVDHQPQPTVLQQAAFPAQTKDTFPALRYPLLSNSTVTPTPQNTSWYLPILAESGRLKQSFLFGIDGVQAFVEEPVPLCGSGPTSSVDLPVCPDDKSWATKRWRCRNGRRRVVLGPLNYRNHSTSPKNVYPCLPPRGSEEDLARRLAVERKDEKKRGKKRVRVVLPEDELVRKRRRTDENPVPVLRTSIPSIPQSTPDQSNSELHAPRQETESDPVMPGTYDFSEQRGERKRNKKRVRFLLPDDESVRKKGCTEENSNGPETPAPSISRLTPDQCNLKIHALQQETQLDLAMPGAYDLQSDDCPQVT